MYKHDALHFMVHFLYIGETIAVEKTEKGSNYAKIPWE